MRRATCRMFVRNAIIAAGNSGNASLGGPLETLRRAGGELAQLAGWAIEQLGGA